MDKIIWLSDIHFDRQKKSNIKRFTKELNKESPDMIVISGDISNGRDTIKHLHSFCSNLTSKVCFVLGNHDYHWKSFSKLEAELKHVTALDNSYWLTESGVVKLNSNICIIGTEGWYDAAFGDPMNLTFSPDWMLIKDLRKLSSMKDRIDMFKKLSEQSVKIITSQIKSAFEKYDTAYLVTHFPPFKLAVEPPPAPYISDLWYSYNTNYLLGEEILSVMSNFPNKMLKILSGHTHYEREFSPVQNVICNVAGPSYCDKLKLSQLIIVNKQK